jgi:hypothetical protein
MFTAQLEALKRYRGGEQCIKVQHQHVNVHDGAQPSSLALCRQG